MHVGDGGLIFTHDEVRALHAELGRFLFAETNEQEGRAIMATGQRCRGVPLAAVSDVLN